MIRDLFNTTLSLSESKGDPDVDGVSILGRVKGNFFFPEGVSRNNRFYSRQLWENVLVDESVIGRMANRNMFGTIGHETALNDESLLEGKFSHIVTSLSINEDGKSGTGEALILGTPAGRVLHTLLSAKCKLYVSSRAEGRFKGESKGVPSVDPDTYKLQTFDFVVDPGFLEANPSLIESLRKELDVLNTNTDEGDTRMSKELIESLTKQKIELETSLSEAMSALEKAKSDGALSAAEIKIMGEEVTRLKSDNAALTEKITKMVDGKLHTEVTNDMNTMKENLAKYKALGSNPEAIREALSMLSTLMDEKKKFTEEVGSYDEVRETLKKAIAMIEGYQKLGTPEYLTEQIRILKQIEDEKAKEGEVNRAKEMADLTGAPFESVLKLVRKGMRDKEIKSFFEGMKKDPSVEKFKVTETKENNDDKDKDRNKRRPIPENRGSRLMSHFK